MRNIFASILLVTGFAALTSTQALAWGGSYDCTPYSYVPSHTYYTNSYVPSYGYSNGYGYSAYDQGRVYGGYGYHRVYNGY